MTHSLDFGPEAAINSRLAELRSLERSGGLIENDAHLVPGVFFNSDPEGQVSITAQTRPDTLLDVEFSVAGPAQWMALHIGLEDLDLRSRLLLGVAVRSQSPKSTSCRLALRSGHAAGFTDTFFRKTLITYDRPSLHLDALVTADHAAVSEPALWRELVLFFRPETAQVNLQDLRIFIL